MTSSEPARGHIAFTKWGRGGYSTDYEGHRIRLVRESDAPRGKEWGAYQDTAGDLGARLAQGRTRYEAAAAAMDRIDEENPARPLLAPEQAAWWTKVATMSYPEALDFVPVLRDGIVIGWTFHTDKNSVRRFGWVAADRRRSPFLVDEREQAAALLVNAVRVAAAALPAQGSGEWAAPEGAPTARGTCPRYAGVPAVAAALAALGGRPQGYSTMGLRLAEVPDEYDVAVPRTWPSAVWGALVLPQESGGVDGRVYGYWLENGRWHRPDASASDVQAHAVADRLSRGGFVIEAVGDGRVSARYSVADPGAQGAPYSDVWSLTNRAGTEVAVIEAARHEAVMEMAQCLPHVRAVLEWEKGIARRRLSEAETARRRGGWQDPARVAVHHCGERGHASCAAGQRLADLDAYGRGSVTAAPAQAADGGSAPQRRAPEYRKGQLVLDIAGRVHPVHCTLWREGDEGPAMSVVTAAGEEYWAAELALHDGTRRHPSEPAGTGDAAGRSPLLARQPLPGYCPAGGQAVADAAAALELFRTCQEADRDWWERAAERAALWAAARFYAGTGELTIGMWRTVVRCAVELHARQFYAAREHAFDPAPEPNSFFGAGRRSLEGRSPEGFAAVMTAARHWAYFLRHGQDAGEQERAEAALWSAAEAFADALGGERQQWMTAVHFLADVHTQVLLGADALRRGAAAPVGDGSGPRAAD